MTEQEKVIESLDRLSDWLFQQYQFVYGGDAPNYYDAYNTVENAIDLLKKQEALPIVYQTNEYTGLPMAHCPSCGEYLVQFHSGVDGKESRFCYYCGQEVKWDG